MSQATPDRRPPLLLLTAAVPQPDGGADRRRAWRLVDLCRRTHRVHVACLVDGPVHLTHWSRSAELCQAVELLPRHQSEHARRQRLHALSLQWTNSAGFECVIADARLWDAARALPASRRVCDLCIEHAEPRWRRWLGAATPASCVEGAAALEADLLLLGADDTGESWGGGVMGLDHDATGPQAALAQARLIAYLARGAAVSALDAATAGSIPISAGTPTSPTVVIDRHQPIHLRPVARAA